MLKGLVFAVVWAGSVAAGADWPDWRGPNRDGRSAEKNLPSRWSPQGENLLWKAEIGGRSAPVVFQDRVYLMSTAGKGESLQERVVCLDANTGKLLWDYKYNVFLSDVPPHRISWASPTVDPQTGNVYVFGVGGSLIGFTREGKKLWERSLAEEMGLVTTHGGRTVSPVVEDDLVVVSGITSGWGEQARAAHRFMAFDKRTGEMVYVSAPGGRPYDTTYSPPVIADIDGMRLFIAGGSDGAMHAIQLYTGQPVWKFVMSKRGINTGAAVHGSTVFVSHSEENLDTNEMGLLAALDGTARGDIQKDRIKWQVKGFQGGYSSPVIDGDRLLQIDNGANLFAFDLITGRQLWKQNLGTIQKASPVLGDGKLYVGTENGKFYIIRPGQEKAEILDADQLPGEQEAIIASAAISDGRIYLVSTERTYCIGRKSGGAGSGGAGRSPAPAPGPAAQLQVTPTEVVLAPGAQMRFRVRVFDGNGWLIGEEKAAQWSLEQLTGQISADGVFTAAADRLPQAGKVKATVGNLTGAARVRVIPPLPYDETFDGLAPRSTPAFWINTAGKFEVREMEGRKVLVKLADNPFTKRARTFFGPIDWSNYTIEAEVSAVERRRQMGDAGLVAQRYNLILFGNNQRLELQSWQPETTRTVMKDFPWKSNTWYRLKLRVENRPDGSVRALGKAWPASEPEPAQWTLERVDPVPNRQGSPGIYADAPFEVYFDNLRVYSNP